MSECYLGVKPLIHQSELWTCTKVVLLKEKFLSLCCILKNITGKCDGINKIGKNKFNISMMMSVWYYDQHFVIELAHWYNSLGVDKSLHLETLSWFHANQSLLPYTSTTNSFIMLAQWHNSLWVDISLHSKTLSW